jgi:zinc dependent phospholipase C
MTIERTLRRLAIVVLIAALPASRLDAYSVLSHEANIDALWDSAIRPRLHERFPKATAEELAFARSYAYGGAVIQDLGYYPFGSHFFSNLLHYVRSGDFVETMIRDAQDLNEYAFAIGALAHYAADNLGHPIAVNRAVAITYPKLRAKYGDRVTYVESPKSHVLVEFSFDVVQVAAGAYAADAYHDFIGFHVATPLLERAFKEVYALDLKDLFMDEDLAIGTYRYAVSKAIPDITKAAARQKHDDIDAVTPSVKAQRVVFGFSRVEYEKEFGTKYRRPGFLARTLVFLYRLLPKIGPFKYMGFKPPTPETERLFLESFTQSRARLRQSIEALGAGRLQLANTNFDTGRPIARGEYSLADETYEELLKRLTDAKFADASIALMRDLDHFFAGVGPEAPARALDRKSRRHVEHVAARLAEMRAFCGRECSGATPNP